LLLRSSSSVEGRSSPWDVGVVVREVRPCRTPESVGQGRELRATATTARFLALRPPRAAIAPPHRRRSQSGPNGPRMYWELPTRRRRRYRIPGSGCGVESCAPDARWSQPAQTRYEPTAHCWRNDAVLDGEANARRHPRPIPGSLHEPLGLWIRAARRRRDALVTALDLSLSCHERPRHRTENAPSSAADSQSVLWK